MNREQLKKLEADLWTAADKLRANSDLKASEYSTPVLGLIFLKSPTTSIASTWTPSCRSTSSSRARGAIAAWTRLPSRSAASS
jgi:hypothetical protein